MRTEDSAVMLTSTEIELLLASLAYYERKFGKVRPEKLAEAILVVRTKLIKAS